jgi:iron transport multicopper oxidase
MRMMRAVPIVCISLLLVAATQAQASEVFGSSLTNSGGDLRTGWYPNESTLTPELVGGGTFGKLWTTPVEGQVYAQPLLDDGTLFVATEKNDLYGLNPATGAQQWTKHLGEPWSPGEISCDDLFPEVGVTSTPVIDPETNVAYLTYKTYGKEIEPEPGRKEKNPEWFMDAVSVSTGAPEPGFPVQLSGTAQNAASGYAAQEFHPKTQLQRPGLLLMEGVVYAAFGSDCDTPEWQGWVFGVSTAGEVKARWVADEIGEGAGIWQSGAGLTSDGPGTILLSTGNGGAPTKPTPGGDPPADLGESIVRLDVHPNGELKAVDFFAPYNAATLDTWDADFASGGVTGLPAEYFGTPAIPHLAVAVGKDGYVYLLNRDNLGGIGQGPSGSDDVVQRIGPYGGVWSRPGVWPGEGGWVYIPTASDGTSAGGSSGNLRVYQYGPSGTGTPSLSLQATSSEAFGFSSSAPIITSDETIPGSALVWIVWAPNGRGEGAQLRAYDPIPVDGEPVMLWSAPIGTSAKFATPGVGAGRLYVGTRDGHVIAFGSPVTPILSGSPTAFGTTTIGDSSEKTLTLTATEPLTLSKLDSSSSQFALGTPSLTLPAELTTGQTIQVPITFSPTGSGPIGGMLTATTSTGKTASFGLSGIGQVAAAKLEVSPLVVTFDGTAVGEHASAGATFRNVGGTPLTIDKVNLPAAPFGVEGPPTAGATIEPGHSIMITVTFNPTTTGAFNGEIGLETTGGNEAIALSGVAGLPGVLEVKDEVVEYGQVAIGSSESKSFTVTNTGGTAVEITKSKPPIGGAFEAATSLSEGTTIAPGESLTETVKFTPTETGPASADWPINGKDATGLHDVQFNGTGIVPEPEPPAGKTLVQPILGSLVGLGVPVPETKTPQFLGAQLAATALTASAAGTIGVRVSCPAGESNCAGTLTLRTLIAAHVAGTHSKAPKRTSVTVAEGTFSVAGGRVSTVRLRLSSRGRALLARTHVLRVQATVTSRGPAGATYTAQANITIRAPRKPPARKAKTAS